VRRQPLDGAKAQRVRFWLRQPKALGRFVRLGCLQEAPIAVRSCEDLITVNMDWQHNGVKIVAAGDLDSNTPQTPGMTRAAAITHARTGASKLWAGTVVVQPNARTGPHHHGELETVLYIVRGRARMRWGNHLEFSGEAGPGDFIYVPPYVPHQEINALPGEPCEAVVVRSGQDPIVVNLDLESPEPAGTDRGATPFHPR
jgi:uncharacterized RmlC-like cupin family protein